MTTPDPIAGQTPGSLNLYARTGDDFTAILEFFDVDDLPIDASGWTLAAHMRDTYGGTLLVDFTFDQTDLETHQWRMTATSVEMEPVGDGVWPWDLERAAGGPSRRTLLTGVVVVSPDVTTGVVVV